MFVGHFYLTLDSKARLTIPAKYRDELSIPSSTDRKQIF